MPQPKSLPLFDLRDYFKGDLQGSGFFMSRFNQIDPVFTFQMKGSWQGNKGRLEEYFLYHDGREQNRVWIITFHDDHSFSATAEDIIGQAYGTQYGNHVKIIYDLIIRTDSGRSVKVSMNDQMFLMPDGQVINRNVMRKFGIKIGELLFSFSKTSLL
jgi:hypothetical protein